MHTNLPGLATCCLTLPQLLSSSVANGRHPVEVAVCLVDGKDKCKAVAARSVSCGDTDALA